MSDFSFHTYQNRLSLRNKLGRMAWNIYAALFFKTMPTKYLNGVRIAGLRLFGAKIGRYVSVHRTACIWAPWNLIMYDYTLIDHNCRVYNPAKITLKSETVVSENVFLCTASHDVNSVGHELIKKPITCNGKNWIAADAIILPGVTLGEGAVVGAGSVVTKDVDEWTVVGGNPAKFLKRRELKK